MPNLYWLGHYWPFNLSPGDYAATCFMAFAVIGTLYLMLTDGAGRKNP